MTSLAILSRSKSLIAAVLLAGAPSLVFVTQTNADTCNPAIKDESNQVCGASISECAAQAGGEQQVYNTGSSTQWPQSAIADISSYNPSPVYASSSAWTALEQNNQGGGLIAQVGWVHNNTSYNEFVFAQWTDNNGYMGALHSFYTTPSGTNNYAVYRNGSSGFDMEWSNGYFLPPSTVNWGSDTVTEAGEVTAFNGSTGDGDHFPGNVPTPVTFSNVNWNDQYSANHIANLSYFGGNKVNTVNGSVAIPPYSRVYNWSGSHFEVWDNRCS